MKKLITKILNTIILICTGRSDEAVDEGICDYSGQGRDRYGR